MIWGLSKRPKKTFSVYIINFGGWEENKREIPVFWVGLNLPGAQFFGVVFWVGSERSWKIHPGDPPKDSREDSKGIQG